MGVGKVGREWAGGGALVKAPRAAKALGVGKNGLGALVKAPRAAKALGVGKGGGGGVGFGGRWGRSRVSVAHV